MTLDTFHPHKNLHKMNGLSLHVGDLTQKLKNLRKPHVSDPKTAKTQLNRYKRGIELTRAQGFLDGNDDLFDLLASPPANKTREATQEQKKEMSTYLHRAMGLLRKASDIIERSENKIAQQDLRIRNLEELSTVDELTGLLNRRGFLKVFAREINRIERRGEQGGLLVLIDLENYAALEKRYDKRAAHKAMFLTGKLLAKEIRDMDAVARTDKDEFILMLTDTTPDAAMERIQRLALRLNSLQFEAQGQEVNIHASISLKAYKSGDTLSKLAGIAEQKTTKQNNNVEVLHPV